MRPHILLIGSGNYGEFAQKALAGVDVEITTLGGREVADGLKTGAFQFHDHPCTHVYIATPNFTHFAMAKPAIEAGKHVLCEKPLALTLDEVTELYELAERHKVYLGVGFVLDRHPFYQAIKDLQAKHGPLTQMRVFNHATEGMLEPEWYWDKQLSGGWFMVAEIHWYHLFAWLTGQTELAVDSASEEIKEGRTCATLSHVTASSGQTLAIDHRIDMDFDTAWTRVEVVFGTKTVVIDDWVPRSISFPSELAPEMEGSALEMRDMKHQFIDTRSRDHSYKDLIRANIESLLKAKPDDNAPILTAHQTALDAQKVSDLNVKPE